MRSEYKENTTTCFDKLVSGSAGDVSGDITSGDITTTLTSIISQPILNRRNTRVQIKKITGTNVQDQKDSLWNLYRNWDAHISVSSAADVQMVGFH